jgi:hypothetical protein
MIILKNGAGKSHASNAIMNKKALLRNNNSVCQQSLLLFQLAACHFRLLNRKETK